MSDRQTSKKTGREAAPAAPRLSLAGAVMQQTLKSPVQCSGVGLHGGAPFRCLFECAGVVEQAAPRRAIKVLKPVMIADGGRISALSPASGFSVSFEIDFDSAAVARQECFFQIGEGTFKSEISRART